MTPDATLSAVSEHFDTGAFFETLARRVAIRTESQKGAERLGECQAYLEQEIGPALTRMGFEWKIHPNTVEGMGPILAGARIEDKSLPTILTYGHGDVVNGLEGRWEKDRDPWALTYDGDRIYGRGTADNKVQHSIHLAALEHILKTRGTLGFNVKIILETGEETGSPGLREFCETHKEMLKSDILFASDGPRVGKDMPTLFTGARGIFDFQMSVNYRDGGNHSGNWGGLIADPAVVLANAIACMIDRNGHLKVDGLKPDEIPGSIRQALGGLEIDPGPNSPEPQPWWGEPGLSPIERVLAWNSFAVRAMLSGYPDEPQNAIAGWARAHCQLRFVVGSHPERFMSSIRAHLDAHGFEDVTLTGSDEPTFNATRLDPTDPLVVFAADAMEEVTGKKTAVVPNLGGSLPNDIFVDVLGLKTLWMPHSYAGCSQHAPNEHILISTTREGLLAATGLYLAFGEKGIPT
ncbi:MAG: M20 family metallopeptidase [Alphaproteobacteria bacterium]|nr:M20 family metallopeptidase [Alphaproteobacteria bacterium]